MQKVKLDPQLICPACKEPLGDDNVLILMKVEGEYKLVHWRHTFEYDVDKEYQKDNSCTCNNPHHSGGKCINCGGIINLR